MKKIVLTGGGTAGHVTPNLALLPKLKELGYSGNSAARSLKTKLETYKIPLLYAKVDKIERTFNGKINRKYYALSSTPS